jgi:hypothetical protein
MKRILTLALALILCLSAVAVLASCDHEHTASADWTKDDTNHWHTCADCEEQLDKAEHTFGEATKVKNGVYSYACTVCGQVKTETETTTITADQFANLTLGENFIVTLSATHQTLGSAVWIEMRDGNKFSTEETMTRPNGEKEEFRNFAAIEGEEVYVYSVEYDDNGVVTSCTKREDGRTPAEKIEAAEKEFIPAEIRDLSLYTYDEATNTYVAATIALEHTTLTNVKIAFENGKIVSMSYAETMEGAGTADYAFTFVYGTASITIPDLTPAE